MYWGKGKRWVYRKPSSVIACCEHYIMSPMFTCHLPVSGMIGSCHFALCYGPLGVECDLLGKNILEPFIPECTKYDFIKKILEVM